MPGIKSYSMLKDLEWLNYSITNEFAQLREFQKKQKEASNPYVMPIFAAVVSLSIAAAVLKQINYFQAVGICMAYLLVYFGNKYIIKPGLVYAYKWYTRDISRIKDDKETCEAKVKFFNSCVCNEILLAYGFLQKAIAVKEIISSKENDVSIKEKVTRFYLIEALHYLERPSIEIITIIDVFYNKIIADGKNKEFITDKSIRLYRLVELVALMKEIIEYIDSETVNNSQFIVDDVFKTDVINIGSKISYIDENLQVR